MRGGHAATLVPGCTPCRSSRRSTRPTCAPALRSGRRLAVAVGRAHAVAAVEVHRLALVADVVDPRGTAQPARTGTRPSSRGRERLTPREQSSSGVVYRCGAWPSRVAAPRASSTSTNPRRIAHETITKPPYHKPPQDRRGSRRSKDDSSSSVQVVLPRRALASDGHRFDERHIHTCAHGLERAVVRAVARAVARAIARAAPALSPAPPAPTAPAPTVDSPYVRVVVHPGAVVALTPDYYVSFDGLVEAGRTRSRAPPEGWGEASVLRLDLTHPRVVAHARARAGRAERRRLEGEGAKLRLGRRRGRSTPVPPTTA